MGRRGRIVLRPLLWVIPLGLFLDSLQAAEHTIFMGIFFKLGILLLSFAALLCFTVENSANVETVEILLRSNTEKKHVQVSGLISSEVFNTMSQNPSLQFEISSEDRSNSQFANERLSVVYNGAILPSLKQGSYVILEGSFDGKMLHAKTLLIKCPSKYK